MTQQEFIEKMKGASQFGVDGNKDFLTFSNPFTNMYIEINIKNQTIMIVSKDIEKTIDLAMIQNVGVIDFGKQIAITHREIFP